VNITKEPVNDTHWKLIVNVSPDDYLNKVEEEIKTLSKKISMDGFRPGKVPSGIAKRQYGNSVLAEELNKMLNDSINNYIKENDLKILFQPLQYRVKEQLIDIYKPESYDFGFEVGLIPEFQLPDWNEKKFEMKVVVITEEMLDKEVERVQSVYGERSYPETSAEGDILTGIWQELNEQGEIKSEGIESASQFSLSLVKDETSKQLLMNLKKEEATDLNIQTAFDNDQELIIHNILRTDHHSAEHMSPRFRFTMQKITRIAKAELNLELFDKAYSIGTVQSVEALREKLKSELINEYKEYSLARLDQDVRSYLVKETSMNLPSDFIQKYLNANKEESQPEVNEEHMAHYAGEVKWELINDRIIRDQQIAATDADVLEKAKLDIANYYGGPSLFAGSESRLTEMAQKILKDEENAGRIRSGLLKKKVTDWLLSQIQTTDKEISYHEFFHHH